MAKEINYLAFYAEPDNPQKRHFTLAATNKIDYICSALHNIGYSVRLVSGSTTFDSEKAYRGSVRQLNEYTILKDFFTIPWKNTLLKLASIAVQNFQVFFELLRLPNDCTLIVYHSLAYMKVVELTHKIRKYNLILEVEEIYADVVGNESLKNREIKFFEAADGFIFPSRLLDESVNIKKKPSVVIHGAYTIGKSECRIERPFIHSGNKHIIHCVYAGTLDPRKGGAIAAAAAAEYLPENYHIHILGFGSPKEIENMQDTVLKIAKNAKAKVTYDGVLSGKEYSNFIQTCDIGLSTQDPNAAFNATSFPSKILSYLSNGLRVVSIRIPAIECSDVADLMYFYEHQTSEEIANAILQIDFSNDYDSRKRIEQLSKKFENEMDEMLEEWHK